MTVPEIESDWFIISRALDSLFISLRLHTSKTDIVWLVINLILQQSVSDICVNKLKELNTRKLVQAT